MNLDNLTPAPWEVSGGRSAFVVANADAEFCCLARQAFDVMMRRKWSVVHAEEGWYAIDEKGVGVEYHTSKDWPDPFTALCAADEWMKKQEVDTISKPEQEGGTS